MLRRQKNSVIANCVCIGYASKLAFINKSLHSCMMDVFQLEIRYCAPSLTLIAVNITVTGYFEASTASQSNPCYLENIVFQKLFYEINRLVSSTYPASNSTVEAQRFGARILANLKQPYS